MQGCATCHQPDRLLLPAYNSWRTALAFTAADKGVALVFLSCRYAPNSGLLVTHNGVHKSCVRLEQKCIWSRSASRPSQQHPVTHRQLGYETRPSNGCIFIFGIANQHLEKWKQTHETTSRISVINSMTCFAIPANLMLCRCL